MDRHINLYSIALTRRNEVLARGVSRVLLGVGRLFVGLYRSYRNRKTAFDTIAHLRALDDHLLRDIGIERHEIRDVVRGRTAESDRLPRGNTVGRRVGEAVRTILQAIRRWNRSRATARQLRRIDRKLLADIGYERDDIDWLAPDLAARSLSQAPAGNDNRARPAA